MRYVVKVEGKVKGNKKVFFADKLGTGTENSNDAQIFHNLDQANEVRDTIQDCVGKKAHAYIVVLP
jgi:hypothetical protein